MVSPDEYQINLLFHYIKISTQGNAHCGHQMSKHEEAKAVVKAMAGYSRIVSLFYISL
jgi:hypothetical protein